MGLNGKQVFIRKTSGGGLYKWSPPNNSVEHKNFREEIIPEYCNAIAHHVLGDDNITQYVTKDNNTHGAYVACNYVK